MEANEWAWDQKGLAPAQKHLLLALADESSDNAPPPDAGYAFAKAGLDTDEGHRILIQLEERGLIDSEHRTVKR